MSENLTNNVENAIRIPYGHLFLLVLLCICIYSSNINGDFIWDDRPFVVENPLIRSLSNMPSFFSRDFWAASGDPGSSMLYRPLVSISFAVDYALWKLNPLGYHITNLFFHVMVCLVCYSFFMLVLGERAMAALAASLVFAVHPAHSESVAWISGRADLLAGFFYLSSLCLYILYRRKGKPVYLVISLLAFGLSLLSKEMAATLPIVIVIYDYFWNRSVDRRGRWLPVACYCIILAIYFFVRHEVLGELEMPQQISAQDFLSHLPWAILTYLRLLFIPVSLNALHALPDKNNTETLLTLLSLVMLLIGLTIFVLRTDRRLFFPIAWICITILPVLNRITMASATPIAERFLYIPSIGYALLIGYGSVLLERHRKGVLAALTVLVMIFSLLTFFRNRVWGNEDIFYTEMIEKAPSTYRGYYNLGHYYYRLGRLDAAIALWEKTLAVNPRMYAVRNNLAVIYEKRKLYDKAMAEYRKILAVKDYPEVHFNMGNILKQQGRYEEAIEEFLSALRTKQAYPEALYNLAMAYEDSGRFAEALKRYEETIKLEPNNPEAHNNLGILHAKMGDREKASLEFRLALKFKPDFYEASYNLSLLQRGGR